MNHPLPLEGPLVNHFQVFRCPPEDTKLTFTAVLGGARGPQGRRGRGHRLGWVEAKGKGVCALELRRETCLEPPQLKHVPSLPFPLKPSCLARERAWLWVLTVLLCLLPAE